MGEDQASADRIILDRLLSEFGRRLDGAVDFWTLVCLGRMGPDPRGFLLQHGDGLRALVVVTRLILGSRADAEPCGPLLSTLLEQCQRLQQAFLALEQYRTLSPEDIRAATNTVAEAHATLRTKIGELGQALGITVSYEEQRTPDREAHYQNILQGLFDTFFHERGPGQPVVSVRA